MLFWHRLKSYKFIVYCYFGFQKNLLETMSSVAPPKSNWSLSLARVAKMPQKKCCLRNNCLVLRVSKHIDLASLHKITTQNLSIYASHNPENLTFFLSKFYKNYTSLKIIFHVIDMMYSNGCHSCDPNTVNVIYKACTIFCRY